MAEPTAWMKEVALLVRERHFRSLLEESRDIRVNVHAAKRSRARRARLIRLARRKGLKACLKRLREPGTTLDHYGEPYFLYDPKTLRSFLTSQRARFERVREFWDLIRTDSIDGILGNLEGLLMETELELEHPPIVRWSLPDLELEGVAIGTMEIHLRLTEFHVEVWNVSANLDSRNGYQHPHVSSDGHVCWNDHETEAMEYHRNGDFLALKDLIDNLLQTYNDRSPYIALEDWENGYGSACGECGDRYRDDDLSYSDWIEDYLCPNCSRWCERCDRTVPDRAYNLGMEACESCLEEEATRCDRCGSWVWTDDVVIHESEDGDDEVSLCPACNQQQEEKEKRDEDKDEARTSDLEEATAAAGDHAHRLSLLAPPVDAEPNRV